MNAWLTGLHPFLRWLVFLLVFLLVIIFLAWILHGVGGAGLHWNVGHLRFDISDT